MGAEDKSLVVHQVSFGCFADGTSAKSLSDFLEYEAGIVLRCRVKTSSTPPESYPDFRLLSSDPQTLASYSVKQDYVKVIPHAFVHFSRPEAALKAFNLASKLELIHDARVLRASIGTETSLRVKQRRTVDPLRFDNVTVVFGNMISNSQFMACWKGPDQGVGFIVDPFDGCCRIVFSRDTAFCFKGTRDIAVIKCDFKVEFLVRNLDEVKVRRDAAPFVMQFRLSSAPLVYYRTADDDIYDSMRSNLLDDEDPWIRTTDFTNSGAIGRCNSIRISFSPRYGLKMEKSLSYMRERRVSEYVMKHPVVVKDEPGFGLEMSDHFFSVGEDIEIKFTLLFLVNAVVHKGIINQHQLSPEFFELLRNQTEAVNETALKHIYSYKNPVFDACKRLKLVQDWLLKNPRLMHDSESELSSGTVQVRRLIITPTKAFCVPPEVEISNRVLRHYSKFSDRFLRVTFMDEGMQQLNSNVMNYHVAPIVKDIIQNSFPQKTTIFKRVKSIMTDGFKLCGRKYVFLAFSSNQLRDRSAWFFSEVENVVTVKAIRSWMGKFKQDNIAKCAARMGQCFSSSYPTVDVPDKEVELLEDIVANGYIFSDGIGKMTPELAMEAAGKLQLLECPSAFQIRYAGCKGVIAAWPGNRDGIRLSIRPSMNKFESKHTVLEVLSWTRFQPGFLNRQIITLLSALNVPDSIFAEMQDAMIFKLNQMLENPDLAFEVLTSSCAEHSNTAAMMLSAGFRPQTEPHLKAMLSCVRAAQLGDLLAKARIFVPKGRWLMGCLDELGVLEHGQCFIQASTPSLESCFLKHGSRFSGTQKNRQVIVGTVAIAKNPCLHPGDIRILEAVDVPGLNHLVDCLVFPQKGDRPHANEASGSDLDGDLYFVTWDEKLLPPGKKSWIPMDYKAPKVPPLKRQISPQDIVEFFLKNMVNEHLGVICNAHVVHADRSEYGALDEKCLQLAELAATAVDFPKTGKLVTMPQALKPKVYPDFMGKADFGSYKSDKILGRLYRAIKDAGEDDLQSEPICNPEDLPYDTDLEIPESSDYLADAWRCKIAYDGQLNALLGQYRVRSEGEVVTGHIWSLPKYNSRKQGELKERLKNAYSSLHKEFRGAFETMSDDFHQLTDDEKNVLLERKASAWYQVTYHPRWVNMSSKMKEPDGDNVPSRLSFAWIATDYLVRIKIKHQGKEIVESQRPISSLAKYLSKRI